MACFRNRCLLVLFSVCTLAVVACVLLVTLLWQNHSTSEPGAYESPLVTAAGERALRQQLKTLFGTRLKHRVNSSLYQIRVPDEALAHGALDRWKRWLERSPAPRPRTLARLVHQSWKGTALPPRFRSWFGTWERCFPDWTHVLWTDADNERFVKNYYPSFYPRYRSFRWHIYRVDAVRFLYLHRFGGIYTDLDNVCLRPFEHLLAGQSLVFADMEFHSRQSDHFMYVQNSLMYSEPGHPFWVELIEKLNSSKSEEIGRPEYLTGPYALMNHLTARWSHYAHGIRLVEPSLLNPFSWAFQTPGGCKDLNRMSDAQVATCIATYNASGAHVVQLHTQTWGNGRTMRRK